VHGQEAGDLGLAAQAETAGGAALVMALFALGSATPLLLLAYGSRGLVAKRRERLAALSARAKPLMGIALLLVGTLVLTGLDKALAEFKGIFKATTK
jgi:cytochrome c biogenesis protein CcdA